MGDKLFKFLLPGFEQQEALGTIDPTEYDSIAEREASRYGLDDRIVKSLISQESGGQAEAVSPKGAIGVMQIMPETGQAIANELGEEFSIEKLQDPETNIRWGTYLLNKNKQLFGRDDLALAAYHGGPGAVQNDGTINPNSNDGIISTTDYVDSVLGRAQGIESRPAVDDLSEFLGLGPLLRGEVKPEEPIQEGIRSEGVQPIETKEDVSFGVTREIEPQKEMGTPEAMARSFAAGAADLALNFARIPETAAEAYVTLNNLVNRGANKVIEAATLGKVKDAIPDFPFEKIPRILKLKEDSPDTKLVREFAENQKKAVAEATNSKDVVDDILAGNFAEAGKLLATQAAAQVPLVLSMMVGGQVGLGAKALAGLAGASQGSAQMDQYWKDVEEGVAKQKDPTVAGANMIVNSAIEGIGESLGTGKIIEGALKTIRKGATKEIADKTVGNVVGRIVGSILKASGSEATEEGIVGFSQTVSDKIFGARPEATFVDAVKEGMNNALVGAVTAAGTTGPLTAYAETRAPETVSEAVEKTQPKIEVPELPGPELAERIQTEQEEQMEGKENPIPLIIKQRSEEIKSTVEPEALKENESEKAIQFVFDKMNVKNAAVFYSLNEEEQAKRFKIVDDISLAGTNESNIAATGIIELNNQIDEIEKGIQKKEEKPKEQIDYIGKEIIFKGPKKKYKGKDVTKLYDGKIVEVSEDGKNITIQRDGQQWNVSIDKVTDIEGVETIPEKLTPSKIEKPTEEKTPTIPKIEPTEKGAVEIESEKPVIEEKPKKEVEKKVEKEKEEPAKKPKKPELVIEKKVEKKEQEVTVAPEKSIVSGQEIETTPTEAQKEAENYKQGHVNIDGLKITIENPVGSTRSGTDESGKKWSQKMKSDYGKIMETKGIDKDHLDIFIKSGYKGGADKVHVVYQNDPNTEKFDEHKVMLGFDTVEAAKEGYLENYEKGWKGLGEVQEMTMDQFKEWSKKPTRKPIELEISDAPVNQNLIGAKERLEKKIRMLEGQIEVSDKTDIPGTFVTGKSGVSKQRIQKTEKQLDKRIDRAVELKKLKDRLVFINAKIRKQKDAFRDAAKKEEVEEQVKTADQKQFDSIEVGDKIDVGGNVPLAVVKKNHATVITEGNVKWKPNEIAKVIKKKTPESTKEKYPTGTKVNKKTPAGNLIPGEIVGTMTIKGVKRYRFKSDKTGKIELLPEGKIEPIKVEPSKPVSKKSVEKKPKEPEKVESKKLQPSEALSGDKKLEQAQKKAKKQPEDIKPSEAVTSPTDEKDKTSEQQRLETTVDTARKSKATGAKKTQQIKAVDNLGKQIQHNPGGPKKGSGWLNPFEYGYFQSKELAWPILKMRPILQKIGVKKEKLLNDLDYAVDEVRGSQVIAQRYLQDYYDPIFEPINKMKIREAGKVARTLSQYLVAKRTEWSYNNRKNYEDAGISLKRAETVVDYIESGDYPKSDLVMGMAKKIWEYTKTLKDIKLKAGIIDQELFENLRDPYYVPFFRDIDTGIHRPSAPMRLMFTATSTGIKRMTGSKSGHKIIDPLQLIVSSTHETITNAARVKVFRNVIALANEHPDIFGDLISKVPERWLKAPNVEHRIQVDIGLREQIDEIAKRIGVKIETSYKLGERGVKGSKKRLGLFDSFNQEIRILYGATESTRAHELGHALDEKYSWIRNILMQSHLNDETDAIAHSRYEGEEVPNKFVRYVNQPDEKIAEFISLYLSNRPMLKELAPMAFGEFERKLRTTDLKDLEGIKPTNVKSMESYEEANYVLDKTLPRGDDIVGFLEKGKLQAYRVPIEMAMAIKNLHPAQIPTWLKWTFTVPKRSLVFTAVTGNPEFIVRNVPKDQFDVAHNTKSIPFVDWFIGAKHIIKGSEIVKLAERSGYGSIAPELGLSGAQRGMGKRIYGSEHRQYLDPLYWKSRGVLKGTKDLSYYLVRFPFRPITAWSQLSEQASRIGVFRRDLIQSGVDINNLNAKDAEFAIRQAVHASRHSTFDPNRFGYSGRLPNEMVPFLNVALEGIDRPIRAWYEPIKEGKVPIRQIMYTGLVLLAYAGLIAWNRRNKYYKEISSREKAENWIIMLDEHSGDRLNIPKGWVQKLILNPAQMIYESMEGLSYQKGWDVFVRALTDLSPIDQGNVVPLALKMFIEPMADYDLYWGQHIEGNLKTRQPEFRFRKRTSETLKSIGKALKISPVMMQHEMNILFTATGKNLLWITDYALGVAGVQKPPQLDSFTDVIIIRKVFRKYKEWQDESSQRIREINIRLGEIKRGGTTYSTRIKKLVKSGLTYQEALEEYRKTRTEIRKLENKKRELENARIKLNAIQRKIKTTHSKIKFK